MEKKIKLAAIKKILQAAEYHDHSAGGRLSGISVQVSNLHWEIPQETVTYRVKVCHFGDHTSVYDDLSAEVHTVLAWAENHPKLMEVA